MAPHLALKSEDFRQQDESIHARLCQGSQTPSTVAIDDTPCDSPPDGCPKLLQDNLDLVLAAIRILLAGDDSIKRYRRRCHGHVSCPRGPSANRDAKGPSRGNDEPHRPYKPGRVSKAYRGQEKAIRGSNGHEATGKTKSRGVAAADRLLACPFYKYNPIKHIRCLTRNDLTGTAFVVQHLNRGHERQPIHCPICGRVFAHLPEMNAHIVEQSCQRQAFRYEGLNVEQLSRIRDSRRGRDEAERWYSLWDIVCPNATRPDSPYVGEPFDEMLGIARRFLRAVRAGLPGGVPVAALLSSHQYDPPYNADESADMNIGIESRHFNLRYLKHLLGVMYSGHDNLSFLASDNIPAPPPYSSAALQNTVQWPPQGFNYAGSDQHLGLPSAGEGDQAVSGPSSRNATQETATSEQADSGVFSGDYLNIIDPSEWATDGLLGPDIDGNLERENAIEYGTDDANHTGDGTDTAPSDPA